jgi:hypothetical protein
MFLKDAQDLHHFAFAGNTGHKSEITIFLSRSPGRNNALAILVSALVQGIIHAHLMQDHLHHPILFVQGKRLSSQVGKTKGELPMESRIHKSTSQEYPFSGERGAAAECRRDIGGEFHPFQTGHQGTGPGS